MFRLTKRVQIISGISLLSGVLVSCSVILKDDEDLYRVWELKNFCPNSHKVRYNTTRCNCKDDDSYKWCMLPRIGNIGFKIPFSETIKVNKNKALIIDNDILKKGNITVKYHIMNQSRVYFTLCKSRLNLNNVLSYAPSLIEIFDQTKIITSTNTKELDDFCIERAMEIIENMLKYIPNEPISDNITTNNNIIGLSRYMVYFLPDNPKSEKPKIEIKNKIEYLNDIGDKFCDIFNDDRCLQDRIEKYGLRIIATKNINKEDKVTNNK